MMSAVRHLSTLTRCARCRNHALDGFLGIAGVSLRATTKPSIQTFYDIRQRRHISTTGRAFEDLKLSQTQQSNQIEKQEILAAELDAVDESDIQSSMNEELELEEANAEDPSSETPWYLQEEDDFVPEPSIFDRQKLPDIPDDAPKNFSEIVQRLSTDIGLDYITLIDLRTLDPPPALGAAVMMLIGTARSEKHLHVSADRFSRWLRAHYRLKPHADGLLGRNELKLRLKRKAKRAKLLGSVGAVQKEDEDDGIRTSWICVDAGIIEETPAVEQSLDDSGIIGFGSQGGGVKLVVQMMTEQKRRELDLETLWEKALARHRKRLAAQQAVDIPDPEEDIDLYIPSEPPKSQTLAVGSN